MLFLFEKPWNEPEQRYHRKDKIVTLKEHFYHSRSIA